MNPDYKKIFLFQIICWIIAFNFFALLRFIILPEPVDIPFFRMFPGPVFLFLFNSFFGLILGGLLGVVDIFIIRSIKSKHSFGYYLIRKSIAYILTITIVLLIIYSMALLITDITFEESSGYFLTRGLTSYLLFSVIVSILIGFISQVNDKFGPGILLPMFFGKYHQPREEYKIFMFVDLTGSTTFAEKYGHVKYSHFIQDFLFDLNLAANQCSGQIYQYVGDEAIVTWDLENGIENLNCIKIFFEFRNILENKKEYYLKKYGDIPRFKAGSNSGNVMVAEVGYLKKEIAFHGDPINTAARIRGLCNQFGKEFLISGYLKEKLPEDSSFEITLIQEAELRGKKSHVQIYAVDQSN